MVVAAPLCTVAVEAADPVPPAAAWTWWPWWGEEEEEKWCWWWWWCMFLPPLLSMALRPLAPLGTVLLLALLASQRREHSVSHHSQNSFHGSLLEVSTTQWEEGM